MSDWLKEGVESVLPHLIPKDAPGNARIKIDDMSERRWENLQNFLIEFHGCYHTYAHEYRTQRQSLCSWKNLRRRRTFRSSLFDCEMYRSYAIYATDRGPWEIANTLDAFITKDEQRVVCGLLPRHVMHFGKSLQLWYEMSDKDFHALIRGICNDNILPEERQDVLYSLRQSEQHKKRF